jgi:hypothetical protein
MIEQAAWLSILTLVLRTARGAAAADEVSAEVVGLAQGDRRVIEAARVHLMVSIADSPPTHRDATALDYLDSALRRGDERNRWHQPLRDRWAVGQHEGQH